DLLEHKTRKTGICMSEKTKTTPFSEEELKTIAKEKVLQRLAVRVHLLAYIGVNIALFVLNYMINGLSTIWFVYPLAGWLIGITAHGVYYILYSKGVSSRKVGLFIHAAVYVVGSFSMLVINYFSGFTYMWFLWPAIFWCFGVLFHAIGLKFSGKTIDEAGEKKSWLERNAEKELQKAKRKSGGA
nr:2TM domain-containing protein [Candidatus Sigynarchaeota archaeon]